MRTRINQKGFSHLALILIVLVLGAIGFSTYKVWSNNRSEDSSKTVKSVETDNEESAVVDSENDTTSGAVIITEWGVKIEFEDADKVTYKMSTNDIGEQFANLYLKDSAASVCQSLGIHFSREAIDGNKNNVGDYHYRLSGGPGACSDDPEGIEGSINQLRVKITGDELGAGKYTVSAAQ